MTDQNLIHGLEIFGLLPDLYTAEVVSHDPEERKFTAKVTSIQRHSEDYEDTSEDTYEMTYFYFVGITGEIRGFAPETPLARYPEEYCDY